MSRSAFGQSHLITQLVCVVTIILKGFFGIFPAPVRPIIGNIARRQVRKTYQLHGLGRHTREEQEGFARRDLQALSSAIGDSGFLLASDKPGYFDFTIAGFLAGIYDQQPPTWINAIAEEFPNLKSYTERVQEAVGVWGRE